MVIIILIIWPLSVYLNIFEIFQFIKIISLCSNYPILGCGNLFKLAFESFWHVFSGLDGFFASWYYASCSSCIYPSENLDSDTSHFSTEESIILVLQVLGPGLFFVSWSFHWTELICNQHMCIYRLKIKSLRVHTETFYSNSELPAFILSHES